MYSIEVNNLTKQFGSFTAVDGISFKVKAGEIFGFLGANGAGKTTAIKMMCGILEPSAGDAIVGGYSIAKDPNNVKRNIGYMSQRFSLYNDLAVGENIDFFGGVYGLEGKEFEERKKWVLETANLQDRENVLTGSLPGGIKQRLALGTAVIHKPSIVFLDEPTSGVDPISRRSFWDLIHDLSEQGVTVFVTTHYLEEAEYCNNIILIDSGELIAEGSSKELKSKYINHKIIEIECSNVIMALDILDKEKFVIDTSIFGNTIHVSVAENEDYTTLIRKALENEKKVKIKRMSEITPTLEDVFIHLMEERKNAV